MTQDQARIANSLLTQQNPILSGVGVGNILKMGSALSMLGQGQGQVTSTQQGGGLGGAIAPLIGMGIGALLPGPQPNAGKLLTALGGTRGRRVMSGGALGAGIGALLGN